MGLFRKNKGKKQRKHIDLSKPLEIIECVGLIIGSFGIIGNIPLAIILYKIIGIMTEPILTLIFTALAIILINFIYLCWGDWEYCMDIPDSFWDLVLSYVPFGVVTIILGSIYLTITIFISIINIFRP